MKREEFVMDTRGLGRLEALREVARRRLRQREAFARCWLAEGRRRMEGGAWPSAERRAPPRSGATGTRPPALT